MRAISLWQPWATLCCLPHPDDVGKQIVRSVKQFETRSWPAKYTGPLLIHAAQRNTWEQQDAFFWPYIEQALIDGGFYVPGQLAYGAIIGQVHLEACHPAEPMRAVIDDYARAMGDYGEGRYAWEINRPVLFREPIPFKGRQGFFNVPQTILVAS